MSKADRTKRRGILSISAAAALLLQPSASSAGQPLFRFSNQASPPIAASPIDEKSTKRPAALLLKQNTRAASVTLAGHRSHSSHSSHRSHTSGSFSSHSSHYSASSTPVTSPPARLYADPHDTSKSTRAARTQTPIEASKPSISESPKPQLDFTDPKQRFKVVSFGRNTSGKIQATILDQMNDDRETVLEGDTFLEYEVYRVDIAKRIVGLRGADHASIVLKLKSK